MAVVFPATPAPNQVVTDPVTNATWRWDATTQRWVPAATGAVFATEEYVRQMIGGVPQAPPAAGQLSLLSSTSNATIQFIPYNGDWIRINGTIYNIPPGGVQATITNAIVDGTAGQTLTNQTVYFVYMFNSGGTLFLEFSVTGHQRSAQVGNIGTEIKQGDETRTLVGMVYPVAGLFVNISNNRLVRSWFNQQTSPLDISVVNYATLSNTYVVMVSGGMLSLGNEPVMSVVSGMGSVSITNTQWGLQLRLDGTEVGVNSPFVFGADMAVCAVTAYAGILSEGYHWFDLATSTTTGWVTLTAGLVGTLG